MLNLEEILRDYLLIYPGRDKAEKIDGEDSDIEFLYGHCRSNKRPSKGPAPAPDMASPASVLSRKCLSMKENLCRQEGMLDS